LNFLPLPAPAGIVAANLRLVALHRLDDVVAADARRLAILDQIVDARRRRRLGAAGRSTSAAPAGCCS
jgi:hypothetical protein